MDGSPPAKGERKCQASGSEATGSPTTSGDAGAQGEAAQQLGAGGDSRGAGLEMRQSAQLEAEIAAIMSVMPGDGGNGSGTDSGSGDAAPRPTSIAGGPQPASVDSIEGLPVLPEIVRNKDLKRELPLICHIIGCGIDLTTQADYYQRYRICKEHLKSPAMLVDGFPQRFCQQCGRFHELSEFDSDKRNCRARLQQHNSRRRKVFAMSQDLKRNKYAKCDPSVEAEAMAAAFASGAAWGWPGGALPPLAPGMAGLPLPEGLHGMLAGLPSMPLPLPGGDNKALDPAALAAAMAAGSAGLDLTHLEPSQGRGLKRDYSGMDGGSELSAGMLRMLSEATLGGASSWRCGEQRSGGDFHAASAEGLLAGRYQQLLNQQQQMLGGSAGGPSRSMGGDMSGTEAADAARFFAQARGGSQLSNAFFHHQQRHRPTPPPGEGGRGSSWPSMAPCPPVHPTGSGGQPSSTLLEQMARRVLLQGAGGGGGGGSHAMQRPHQQQQQQQAGSWGPTPDVKDHPEAQALSAVYPELAAQIQLLSQQLQAVQSQLAAVMPENSDPGTGGGSAQLSAGAAQSWEPPGAAQGALGSGSAASGGRQPTQQPTARAPPPMFSASGWQRPQTSAAPPPQVAALPSGGGGGGGFTAEDLLKAFAAGMQQNSGGGATPAPSSAPSHGGGSSSSLHEILAKATGMGLPASIVLSERAALPAPMAVQQQQQRYVAALPPPPGFPGNDLPPDAWSTLQALLHQPSSSPTQTQPSNSGAAGGGGSSRQQHAAAGPPTSAIEQLSAALRAANGPQPPASAQAGHSNTWEHQQPGGQSSRGGGGGGGGGGGAGVPMQDMFAFLASMGGGPGGSCG